VRFLVQPPAQPCGHTRLLTAWCRWVFKLSKDGDCTTAEGNCSNALLSSRSGKAAVRSFLRQLFYRPNKPSSLSLSSFGKCCNSLTIFVALIWTCSDLLRSVVYFFRPNSAPHFLIAMGKGSMYKLRLAFVLPLITHLSPVFWTYLIHSVLWASAGPPARCNWWGRMCWNLWAITWEEGS